MPPGWSLASQLQFWSYTPPLKKIVFQRPKKLKFLIENGMGMRSAHAHYWKQNLRLNCSSSSSSAVFIGNFVTPMSTLAKNKRSYSKTWKISGQNCVFSCFSGENFVTILSRRSRLSRTSRALSRLSRPRLIDCDKEPEQTVKTFPGFVQFFLRTS